MILVGCIVVHFRSCDFTFQMIYNFCVSNIGLSVHVVFRQLVGKEWNGDSILTGLLKGGRVGVLSRYDKK